MRGQPERPPDRPRYVIERRSVDLSGTGWAIGPLSPKGVLYLVAATPAGVHAWQVPSLGGPAVKGWPMVGHDDKGTNRLTGP